MRKTIAILSTLLLVITGLSVTGLAGENDKDMEKNTGETVATPIDPDDVLNRHAVWMKWRDDRLNIQKDPFDNEEPRRAEGESEDDFNIRVDDYNLDKNDPRYRKAG